MPRPSYPPARRVDIVDELHGRRVPDPYRWLEDADSQDSRTWSKAQDELCYPHLDSLPAREHFRRRLTELQPGLVGLPAWRGERAFFMRREPGQDHAVFFVREPDSSERPLIDPNVLSEDKTVTLDVASVSKEGSLLAYQLSEGGDEESVLWVMDVDTGEIVDGPIDRCRYSPVAWLPGGDAFYFVRKLPAADLPEGEEQLHRRVFLHQLGADPARDTLVFGEKSPKSTYFGVSTSLDGRWLMVSAAIGTAPRNDLWIADLQAGRAGHAGHQFAVVQQGLDASTSGGVHTDGRLYLTTDLDAPRNRLVVTDPQRPSPEHWRDLLPQTDDVLTSLAILDDVLVAVYCRDVVDRVSVHDKSTGALRGEVPLPGPGSAFVAGPPDGGDQVWISYTDHLRPTCVLRHSVTDGTLAVWAAAPNAPDVGGITVKQVFYESRDATRVPMFVIARDDTPMDGRRPTILYGYGGFNVAMSAGYDMDALAWAEAGGVYAIANLRGGSEYGEEWHRAGMRERKQNVFDDFIAAGEWLIADGYTSTDRLAVMGGSNGGLLVGAALTQRPDLFGAVVCSAPLLDMVRYEGFGLGVTWNDEYGTASDSTELGWLLAYSPYHRVAQDVAYPAVLFAVFDSDTRVDPMHARKMCAALQHATSSHRPILLRREVNVGHGARAMSRLIGLRADELAFLAKQVGLTP